MHRNQRELLQHLFFLATALLEDTHEISYRGMGSKFKAKDYGRQAEQLAHAGRDLTAIAEAIQAALRPSIRL